MESYNVKKNNEYKTSNSYAPLNISNNTYGSDQNTNISLTIYSSNDAQPKINRKSKCPRGAILGEIGTCCGLNCTRACAIAD